MSYLFRKIFIECFYRIIEVIEIIDNIMVREKKL